MLDVLTRLDLLGFCLLVVVLNDNLRFDVWGV